MRDDAHRIEQLAAEKLHAHDAPGGIALHILLQQKQIVRLPVPRVLGEKRLQVGGPAERFSRSAAELERSLATAKVLLREIRRLRTTMVGVRALVPRK